MFELIFGYVFGFIVAVFALYVAATLRAAFRQNTDQNQTLDAVQRLLTYSATPPGATINAFLDNLGSVTVFTAIAAIIVLIVAGSLAMLGVVLGSVITTVIARRPTV